MKAAVSIHLSAIFRVGLRPSPVHCQSRHRLLQPFTLLQTFRSQFSAGKNQLIGHQPLNVPLVRRTSMLVTAHLAGQAVIVQQVAGLTVIIQKNLQVLPVNCGRRAALRSCAYLPNAFAIFPNLIPNPSMFEIFGQDFQSTSLQNRISFAFGGKRILISYEIVLQFPPLGFYIIYLS